MKAISVEKTVKEMLSHLFFNGKLKSKNSHDELLVEFCGFVEDIIIPKDVYSVISSETTMIFYNHDRNVLFYYNIDIFGNKILSAFLAKKGNELLLAQKREFLMNGIKGKLLMQWRNKSSFLID